LKINGKKWSEILVLCQRDVILDLCLDLCNYYQKRQKPLRLRFICHVIRMMDEGTGTDGDISNEYVIRDENNYGDTDI
jgi:hypothetical protein